MRDIDRRLFFFAHSQTPHCRSRMLPASGYAGLCSSWRFPDVAHTRLRWAISAVASSGIHPDSAMLGDFCRGFSWMLPRFGYAGLTILWSFSYALRVWLRWTTITGVSPGCNPGSATLVEHRRRWIVMSSIYGYAGAVPFIGTSRIACKTLRKKQGRPHDAHDRKLGRTALSVSCASCGRPGRPDRNCNAIT